MIPFLLDALTIFFIVAGLVLLWLNLRAWRRLTVPIALPEHEEYLAGMSDADIAWSRAQAEECLEQAASNPARNNLQGMRGMGLRGRHAAHI
jgi:hypothetical protein